MNTCIVYASRRGSTAECAGELAGRLGGQCKLINIAEEKPVLDGVDKVILGSHIMAGKIDKKLARWVKKNKAELGKRKAGLFFCSGETGTEAVNKFCADNYGDLVTSGMPRASFGGRMSLDKERGLVKFLLVNMIKTDSYDRIDKTRIDDFAGKIKAL